MEIRKGDERREHSHNAQNKWVQYTVRLKVMKSGRNQSLISPPKFKTNVGRQAGDHSQASSKYIFNAISKSQDRV